MIVSRIWMFNLILAAVAVFFGISAYSIWNDDGGDRRPAPVVSKGAAPGPDPEKKFVRRLMPQEASYDVVAADNLFSPEREEPQPEAVEPEAAEAPKETEVRISGEAIHLYGVVMLDDYKKALINNPDRSSRGRGQMWVAVGDRLSNLTVQEIRKESIRLVEGKKTYDVLLYDKDKDRLRAAAPSAASRRADAPTVITNAPPPKKAAPVAPAATKAAKPADKRIMDNPFRRKFPR